MAQQIEHQEMTEEQISNLFNDVQQSIEEMYDRLDTNPNTLLRSMHLIRVNNENEERTEFVRSEVERDDTEFVRRDFYRTYITQQTAEDNWVYFFRDDENEVTLNIFSNLYVNDANQIFDTEQLLRQIGRYIFSFPILYNNNREIYYNMNRKMLLIHYNTLNYDRAFDEYYRETYDN